MILQMREVTDKKRPVSFRHFLFFFFFKFEGWHEFFFPQPNYNMLHVTPLKAILVDCTEVSASFNDEGIQGMKVIKKNIFYLYDYDSADIFKKKIFSRLKFYSDLYNLAMDHCSQHAKEKIENVSYDLSETICEMLCAIRPLSFS